MIYTKRVNGVAVRANRKMTTIAGSKIYFADGSWCDVATGEIVAQKGATISFSEKKPPRRRTRNLTASNGSVVAGNITGCIVSTGRGNVIIGGRRY